MGIILKKTSSLKPHSRLNIDYGHPLAKGLIGCYIFNEEGRKVSRDITGSTNNLNLINGTKLGHYKNGPHLLNIDPAQKAVKTINSRLKPTKKVSLMWRGVVIGEGYRPQNPSLIAVTYDQSNSNPYLCYSINRSGSGQPNIGWYWNDGTFRSVESASIVYGDVVTFILTLNGDTAVMKGYKDGIEVASSANVGTISYTATSSLLLGGHYTDDTMHVNAACELGYIWNRDLTPAEVKTISRRPYVFIRNKPRVLIFPKITSGGGSATATPSLVTSSIIVNTSTESFNTSSTASPSLISQTLLVNTSTANTGSNATASPSVVSQSIIVNTSTISFQTSSTASPSLVSQSIIVNASTITFSAYATATPSLVSETLLVNTSTVTFNTSSTASPSLAEASFTVFTASASSNGSQNATATPSLISQTLLVNQAVAVGQGGSTAVPSLASMMLSVETPTASFLRNNIATPSQAFLDFVMFAPTPSVRADSTASPSLITNRIIIYDPSAGSSIGSGIGVRISLKSQFEKYLTLKSALEK